LNFFDADPFCFSLPGLAVTPAVGANLDTGVGLFSWTIGVWGLVSSAFGSSNGVGVVGVVVGSPFDGCFKVDLAGPPAFIVEARPCGMIFDFVADVVVVVPVVLEALVVVVCVAVSVPCPVVSLVGLREMVGFGFLVLPREAKVASSLKQQRTTMMMQGRRINGSDTKATSIKIVKPSIGGTGEESSAA